MSVVQDRKEAVRYYKLSAEQGTADGSDIDNVWLAASISGLHVLGVDLTASSFVRTTNIKMSLCFSASIGWA